jgi:hypothetical protein
LFVASTIGAALLYFAAEIDPIAPFLVFLGGTSMLVLLSVLRSEGVIDLED